MPVGYPADTVGPKESSSGHDGETLLLLSLGDLGLVSAPLRARRGSRTALRNRSQVLMNEIPERPPQKEADQFLLPVVKQNAAHDFLRGAGVARDAS